ncbi:MAG: aldo/keto reductase [Candidatus Woesearchaeota archaeon]|nr:aldo/keto reductase [Candidatus Woesearchaeota archaeon]
MQTKRLSNGFKLQVLAIGTYGMGGEDCKPDYSQDNKHIKAIQEAINMGYSHIDTAEIYGGGHTEELVGKAIKKFDRKKLFITTKVAKEHLKYDDLINSAKKSLQRLSINYIDLYLVHAPNPDISIKETMEAMNYLVDNGLIKNIGVSNFNLKQMKEAQKYSKHSIVANQLKYNLWAKFIDLKTILYCQQNDIMVIAYKPFGRGSLTKEKSILLSALARKYNKTEAQIILNLLISKKNVVALFKSGNVQHLKENKNIFDFKLTKEENKKIDALIHYSGK